MLGINLFSFILQGYVRLGLFSCVTKRSFSHGRHSSDRRISHVREYTYYNILYILIKNLQTTVCYRELLFLWILCAHSSLLLMDSSAWQKLSASMSWKRTDFSIGYGRVNLFGNAGFIIIVVFSSWNTSEYVIKRFMMQLEKRHGNERNLRYFTF